MARFYQTDKPIFVEDFTFRPPYELMDRALQVQQQGLDGTVNTAAMFKNIDVSYIPDQQEREYVEKVLQGYSDRADNLVSKIQKDPMNWKRYSSELNNLRNQLTKDWQTGDIARIQTNAKNYADHWKRIDSTVKDPVMNQKLKEEALQKWKAAGRTSGGGVYEDTPGYEQRDLFLELSKRMKELPLDSYKEIKDLLAGMAAKGNIAFGPNKDAKGRFGYIREISGMTESNREKAMQIIDPFFNDPATKALLEQMTRLGIGNYVDKNGDIRGEAVADIIKGALAYTQQKKEYTDNWSNDATALKFWEAQREDNRRKNEVLARSSGATISEYKASAEYHQRAAELLNGFDYKDENGNSRRYRGFFERLYNGYIDGKKVENADYMRRYYEKKGYTNDQILVEMMNTVQNNSKYSNKDKRELISQLSQAKKELETRRNYGVAALATSIQQNENCTYQEALERAAWMTDEYRTQSNRMANQIPLNFGGGTVFSVDEMNNVNKMRDGDVALTGSPAINLNTLQIEIVTETDPNKIKEKYTPILGATYKENGADYLYTADRSSQNHVGTHSIRVEYKGTDGKTKTLDDVVISDTYGGPNLAYSNLNYMDSKTNYTRRTYDEIDENKVAVTKSNIRTEQSDRNMRIGMPKVRGLFSTSRLEEYNKNIAYDMNTLNVYEKGGGAYIYSDYLGSGYNPRKLAQASYDALNSRKTSIMEKYRAWLKENDIDDSPRAIEAFKNETDKFNPQIREILELQVNATLPSDM